MHTDIIRQAVKLTVDILRLLELPEILVGLVSFGLLEDLCDNAILIATKHYTGVLQLTCLSWLTYSSHAISLGVPFTPCHASLCYWTDLVRT